MPASTKAAAGSLLLLGSAAALLMTFSGLLFLFTGSLINQFAHLQRSIGEIDGISIALVFGGIAAALKALEIRMRTIADEAASTE